MKQKKVHQLIVSFLILLSFNIYGQDKLINPSITFLDFQEEIPIYKCEAFDIDARVEEAKNDLENGVSPLIFAKKFPVSLTPENSGIWEEKDDLRIWRLQIESEKAYSMMLIFDELNLPPYSSLFVYDKDLTYIAGPYTENYSESKVLPTPLIPGSSIIVEMAYQRDSVILLSINFF